MEGDAALEILKQNIVDRRMRWYETNKKKLTLGTNPLENAYTIITERLKLVDDADVVMKGDKTIIFRTTKPCPVNEACKILEIDCKRICKAVCEKAANDFLQNIDGRLRFSIEHKEKNGEEITEETIELKK